MSIRFANPTTTVEGFYTIRNQRHVLAYLNRQADLSFVLAEAIDPLQRLFGQDVRVVLEVVADPEAEGIEQLFAYVQVAAEDAEEAFEMLDHFDDEWFLAQLGRVGSRLNFSLELE